MDPLLLTPEAVRRLIEDGETVVVLDARGRAAFARATERVAGDLRATSADLAALAPTLPRSAWLLAYCT